MRGNLPWRESRDPYRVWVSEIMLQQTRVAAVIAHYHEFLRRFPTVQKLAAAREASVLAAWSGLGYYRRARMMHAAAKVIARELGGKFPSTADAWRELPGIGRYTSAAIASIAFDEPVAVVDGNVERVLARVSGPRLAGEKLWAAAEAMLDRQRPGDFNQAMMELGATVCTPRGPACLTCPVIELCATRGRWRRGKSSSGSRSGRFTTRSIQARSGIGVSGAAGAGCVADGGDVGVAGGGRCGAGKKKAASSSAPLIGMTRVMGMARFRSVDFYSVRHSITVTDYTVRVWRQAAPAGYAREVGGGQIACRRLR